MIHANETWERLAFLASGQFINSNKTTTQSPALTFLEL